ncbi:hypothetical protein PDJAM_G00085100 [Pangasius djambal]|uniref:Uncharacterized protein n=1 Tax=Pangasius djambal TaxID=1691987 RepID=A0ACC5Z4B3_9TELE|nr:hypothetical protein [Pangasius djambal]
MPRSCSQCGSSSVVEDELYSQTQWVCQDCGSVISEGTFTTILSEEQHSTAVPYYVTTEVTKKPCPNLIKGLGRVRSLCRILRLSKHMESEVASLYERAYNHPHFLNGHLMKKEMLGGSCLLSVCRQNNWPVAMGTISMLLDADPASIGAVYHDLNKALNLQNTSTSSFAELLESHCHDVVNHTSVRSSTAVPYYVTTEVTKKPCPNLIKGLGRVRSLCRILRLSKHMESEVASLYERAYNHPHFLNGHLMKKEMLGGSCLLSVCRQNNWPVAMGTISMLLDADPASIGAVYHDLNKALNLQNTSTSSFAELLESHCHEFKLGPSDVPDICVESVERLVQRSTALLELASDVWLVTGRQPLPLLTACVYVAWQSLKPMARMKYTLNKFCEIARLPKLKQKCAVRRDTAARRVSEIREALFKLGPSDVPDICVESVERLVQRSTALLELASDVWLVTGRQPLPLLTACVYVAWQSLKPMARMKYTLNKFCEIARLPKLKQKCAVRRDTAARRVSEIREALCKMGRVLPWLREGTVEPGSVCTLVDDILSYRRTLMLQAMRNCELEEDAEEQNAASSEEAHWGKRHLFLPPSARNAKRPRPNSPEPDVIGDENISDTEIESYIRSPEEVKLYLEVQKKLTEDKK